MSIAFEVLKHEGVIVIDSVNDSFPTIELDIQKFWNWVKYNDLNTFCEDYFDPNEPDGHGQNSGTLNFDEYFDMHYELIKKDIEQYLRTHQLRNK